MTIGPCPLCNKPGSGRVASALALEAFGVGSVHESCIDEVCELLRDQAHPSEWPVMLRAMSEGS